jgi:hypothetical protein
MGETSLIFEHRQNVQLHEQAELLITCHITGAKGLIICQVACYMPHSTPNMPKTFFEMPRWKNMKQRADWWVKIEAKGRGQKGGGGEKSKSTFVLTALTTLQNIMLMLFLHLKVRIIVTYGLISLATMQEMSLFHAIPSCSDENLNLLMCFILDCLMWFWIHNYSVAF